MGKEIQGGPVCPKYHPPPDILPFLKKAGCSRHPRWLGTDAILSRRERAHVLGTRTRVRTGATWSLFLHISLWCLGLRSRPRARRKDAAFCRVEGLGWGSQGSVEGRWVGTRAPLNFPEDQLPLGRSLKGQGKKKSWGCPVPSPALWGQSLPTSPYRQCEKT